MKKALLALGLLGAVALAPATASAEFSLAIPGLRLQIGPTWPGYAPPPAVYVPPPVYYAPPPVVYAPRYGYGYGWGYRGRGWNRGYHRGWR